MTEIDDLKEGIQKSISGLDLGTISKDPELAFIYAEGEKAIFSRKNLINRYCDLLENLLKEIESQDSLSCVSGSDIKTSKQLESFR